MNEIIQRCDVVVRSIPTVLSKNGALSHGEHSLILVQALFISHRNRSTRYIARRSIRDELWSTIRFVQTSLVNLANLLTLSSRQRIKPTLFRLANADNALDN